MFKELLINRGIDLAAWRSKRGEYPLTPEGEKTYNTFIDNLKKGIPMNITDYMGILDGYDYVSGVKGLENLYKFTLDKPPLVLVNHEEDLPLNGRSLIFPIGYHIKKATEKEIRWVYGTDISLDQFGKEAYEKSLNFILVGGKNLLGLKKTQVKGVREILRATGKDVVGLYPEGDNGSKLLKGRWEAAGIIANAASRGTNIICTTIFLNGKTFDLTFQTLDDDKVLDLWRQKDNTNDGSPTEAKLIAAQNVVDYAMNTIALPLPQKKRGYYQNPEHTLGMNS